MEMTNTKRIVKFAADLQEQYKAAVADGSFSVMDGFTFVDELSQVPEIIKIAPAVVNESKNATHADRQDLQSYVESEFELDSAHAEELISDAVDAAIAIHKLVTRQAA